MLTDPGTLRFSDGTSMAASGEVEGRQDACRWVRFEGDGARRDRGLRRPRRRRLSRGSARATGATCSTRRRASSGRRAPTVRGSSRSIRLSAEDFVEANAWQSTWFTSHDVMGLANLLGGEEVYAEKLDFAFEQRQGVRLPRPTTATATSATATRSGCRWPTSSTTSATRGCRSTGCGRSRSASSARPRPPTATATTTRTRARWAR